MAVCLAAVVGLLTLFYGVWWLGSRSPAASSVAAAPTSAESIATTTGPHSQSPPPPPPPPPLSRTTQPNGNAERTSRPAIVAPQVGTSPRPTERLAPMPSQQPRPTPDSPECPTGTMSVEIPLSSIKVAPFAQETYRHVTAHGVLKNTTSGDVFLFADDPPSLLALDGAGNILEMVTVGTFDNQRSDGVPRTSGIVLRPGQSIGFTLDEERGNTIDGVVTWFADARVGALMAPWNQAPPDCPSPLKPAY